MADKLHFRQHAIHGVAGLILAHHPQQATATPQVATLRATLAAPPSAVHAFHTHHRHRASGEMRLTSPEPVAVQHHVADHQHARSLAGERRGIMLSHTRVNTERPMP